MKEANAPIDIGPQEIKQYKSDIENLLTGLRFSATSNYSLPNLIRKIDSEEPQIMSHLETNTYLAVRTGLQIFKSVYDMVADKVDYNSKMLKVERHSRDSDPELGKLRGFINNFAAYTASKYITKQVEKDMSADQDAAALLESQEDAEYLKQIRLHAKQRENQVLSDLLMPVAQGLINHDASEEKDFFPNHGDFSLYVRNVFKKYSELAYANKDNSPELLDNVEGYEWRIMDDLVSLEGYEDKSKSHIKVSGGEKPAFKKVHPDSIVGNVKAKQKLLRYAERLVLYDFEREMNPVYELGGLAWSVIMDGPPGTGKTSMLGMFMTSIGMYADALEVPYTAIAIDQSIKDEYYGKTGKILLEKLASTKDPQMITAALFEDIDLITSNRNEAQGADNDVNNIIMQYLDGVSTVRRGNIINFASTNKATGLDDAMRNRFNDRLFVDGPITAEDFADISNYKIGGLLKNKLANIELGYTPLETQRGKAVEAATRVAEEFEKKYKKATLLDFGKFLSDAKVKNELITGRSANAILEAVKERSANFDIPKEWLSNRSAFVEKPYETKVKLIRELYTPITPPMVFEEASRYIESEERYAQQDAKDAIDRKLKHMGYDQEARIKFLSDPESRRALIKGTSLEQQLNKELKAELNGQETSSN